MWIPSLEHCSLVFAYEKSLFMWTFYIVLFLGIEWWVIVSSENKLFNAVLISHYVDKVTLQTWYWNVVFNILALHNKQKKGSDIMLIILFTMFTIIEVVLEMLGVIDTEYKENCFEIVVSSAIFPRNKSPPLKWHSNTLTLPTVSQEVGRIWLLSIPNMVSTDYPVCFKYV